MWSGDKLKGMAFPISTRGVVPVVVMARLSICYYRKYQDEISLCCGLSFISYGGYESREGATLFCTIPRGNSLHWWQVYNISYKVIVCYHSEAKVMIT